MVRLEQPLKALYPIDATDEPIVRFCSFVHPKKVRELMAVTELPIVTVVKAVQP